MVDTALPLYVRELGIGMLGVGIFFTSATLLETVFAVPAGWAADRFNRARAELEDKPIVTLSNASLRGLVSRVKSLFRSFFPDMVASWRVFIRDRNLVTLVAIGTLGSLSYGVSVKYFIIYFNEILRFDSMQIGVLFSLAAAGSALAGILGGLFSDRLGRRTVLVISALGSAALTFAFVYVRLFELMAALFFFLALVGGVWAPNYQVLLGELTPELYRGRVFSFMDVVFTTGGMAVGPLLGGWLWIAIGPSSVFISDAMLTLACGICVLLLIGKRAGEIQGGE
jgi:MFS family permease